MPGCRSTVHFSRLAFLVEMQFVALDGGVTSPNAHKFSTIARRIQSFTGRADRIGLRRGVISNREPREKPRRTGGRSLAYAMVGTFQMPDARLKPPSLSVFFPALNDSGTIASMVIGAVQAASGLTPDYEVIVVNDGSTDATAQIADELARTYSHVRVVHHPANRGYGGALQTGFRTATKDLIFYTDGDAQYDPAELSLLWPRMTPTPISSTATRSIGPIRCTASSWTHVPSHRLHSVRLKVRDVDAIFD